MATLPQSAEPVQCPTPDYTVTAGTCPPEPEPLGPTEDDWADYERHRQLEDLVDFLHRALDQSADPFYD